MRNEKPTLLDHLLRFLSQPKKSFSLNVLAQNRLKWVKNSRAETELNFNLSKKIFHGQKLVPNISVPFKIVNFGGSKNDPKMA